MFGIIPLSRALLAMLALSALVACAGGPSSRDSAPGGPAEPALQVAVTMAPDEGVTRPVPRPVPRPGLWPGSRADTSDRADATASDARAEAELLGETLAGLGAPSERGLWLRTGLVDETRQGRVKSEGGETLAVELRPSGRAPGAGSHLSLEAMQTLKLPLTRLATLRVFTAP